jgi:LysM repeat protein
LQNSIGRPVILPLFHKSFRAEKEISRHLVCFIKPRNKKVSKILRSALSFSLLFGTLFVPAQAKAGFFSSLFVGDQAYADVSANTITPPQPGSSQNLQNIPLLVAGVSSDSILNDKDNKKDSQSYGQTDSDDTNLNIVADNAILPATGPMGVSDGTITPDPSSNDTSVYVVRDGDNIATIAKMFNVSVDTILWANDMKKGEKLTTGEVLLILPVTGVEYTVKKGDKLQSIADQYKIDVNDIVQNNDITLDTLLSAGDTLIIPNGEEKSTESATPIPDKDLGASIAKDKQYYEQHPVQNLAGYYIDPVPGYRLSQGLHDNNAVDLAISAGTPIHAAADGKVILARYGYNGGFGNVVIIDHPNGTQTLYAHQSKLATVAGAEVFQGEVIGYVGTTGRSTGPHLHFEVHGAQNPGVNGSWKY